MYKVCARMSDGGRRQPSGLCFPARLWDVARPRISGAKKQCGKPQNTPYPQIIIFIGGINHLMVGLWQPGLPKVLVSVLHQRWHQPGGLAIHFPVRGQLGPFDLTKYLWNWWTRGYCGYFIDQCGDCVFFCFFCVRRSRQPFQDSPWAGVLNAACDLAARIPVEPVAGWPMQKEHGAHCS